MQSSDNWAEEFTKGISRAIDQARHGKSDQWIADQAKEIGHPISRTAVSEYRRGIRKNVPVTDLIVIARVLRVPPIYLLFPNLPEGPAFPFPGQPDTAAVDAMRWFTGESEWATPQPFYDADRVTRFDGGPARGFAEYARFGQAEDREPMLTPESDLVWLSRSLVNAFRLMKDNFGTLDEAGRMPKGAPELFHAAQEQINDLTTRLKKLGGTFRTSDHNG